MADVGYAAFLRLPFICPDAHRFVIASLMRLRAAADM